MRCQTHKKPTRRNIPLLRNDWKAKNGGKAVESLAQLTTVHTWLRYDCADCNFQHSVRLSGVDLSEAGPVSSSCLATLPPTATELHVSGASTLAGDVDLRHLTVLQTLDIAANEGLNLSCIARFPSRLHTLRVQNCEVP
jgi:hypothetical protein